MPKQIKDIMKKLLLFALLITFISCKKEEELEVTPKIIITLKSSNEIDSKKIKIKVGINYSSSNRFVGSKTYEIKATEKLYECSAEYTTNGNYNDSLIIKGLNTDTAFILENKKIHKFVIK